MIHDAITHSNHGAKLLLFLQPCKSSWRFPKELEEFIKNRILFCEVELANFEIRLKICIVRFFVIEKTHKTPLKDLEISFLVSIAAKSPQK